MSFLLANGADVKAKNQCKGSALVVAANYGHLDALKRLVEKREALASADIALAIEVAEGKLNQKIVDILKPLLV